MKKRSTSIKNIITLLVTLTLITVNTLPGLAADTSRAAKITDLAGTVSVQKSGGEKKFTAFKGMSLTQGDSISTGKGSWVELEIDDDKLVKITENTQLGVSELTGSIESGDDKTGLKLWFGKVWTNIKKKLNVRSKYEIRTPKTVMGVRGTQFFVGEEGGKTVVAVLEGRVYAVSYTSEQRPDGTVLEQAVEAFIEQNQQTVIDHAAPVGTGITVQPVQLNTLPSSILEEIRKNPEGIEPSLIQNIDSVIEQRRTEEASQEQIQQQQLQQTQSLAPQISQDPIVSSPPAASTSSGSSSSRTEVSNPVIQSISAQNGSINIIFDKVLLSAPDIVDFDVLQNTDSTPIPLSISNIQWNNASAVTLAVPPLQPANSLISYHYSVRYKNGQFYGSNNIEVKPIGNANVSIVGSSTITSGSTAQINITGIVDQNESILNSNGIYDNSWFNVRLSSDIETAAEIICSDVRINRSGNVISPALGIQLTTVGTHTVTVELNGKVLNNSLTVKVVPQLSVVSKPVGNVNGFILGPSGTATVTFSNPLTVQSMVDVQTALYNQRNFSDGPIGYSWNPEHTILTFSETTATGKIVLAKTDNVICSITDIYGNTLNDAVIVSHTTEPFLLSTAQTLDSNNNGNIDLIKLVFSANVDQSSFDTSLSSTIIVEKQGDGLNLLGNAVLSGLASEIDLNGLVDNNNDNTIYLKVIENSIYNTGVTSRINLGNISVIKDPAGNDLSSVGYVDITDGCAPVITHWSMNMNPDGDSKYISVYLSENISPDRIDFAKMSVSGNINTAYNLSNKLVGTKLIEFDDMNSQYYAKLHELTPNTMYKLSQIAPLNDYNSVFFLAFDNGVVSDGINSLQASTSGIDYMLEPDTRDNSGPWIDSTVGGTIDRPVVKFTDYIDQSTLLYTNIVYQRSSTPPPYYLNSYNNVTRELTFFINGLLEDGDMIIFDAVKDSAGNFPPPGSPPRLFIQYNSSLNQWIVSAPQ